MYMYNNYRSKGIEKVSTYVYIATDLTRKITYVNREH